MSRAKRASKILLAVLIIELVICIFWGQNIRRLYYTAYVKSHLVQLNEFVGEILEDPNEFGELNSYVSADGSTKNFMLVDGGYNRWDVIYWEMGKNAKFIQLKVHATGLVTGGTYESLVFCRNQGDINQFATELGADDFTIKEIIDNWYWLVEVAV